MGAIDILKKGADIYINLPENVDKDFYNSLLENSNNLEKIKTVIFNFQKTEKIDRNFYSIFHQVKQKIQELDGHVESINLNHRIKSQLLSDGVIRLFNIKKKSFSESKKEVKNNKKIEVEFIKPFIESTVEILKVQANTEAQAKKPKIKFPEQNDVFDIVGVITLISNVFEGSITLCFKQDVFLKICSNMLDEEFTEITDEIEDAAGELLNIIFGLAKSKLNDQKGYKIEKAIPTILRGPGIRIKQIVGPTIVLPFESDAGSFHIEIELSDTKGD